MPRSFNLRYHWTLDDYIVFSKAFTRLTKARRVGQILHAVIDVLLLIAAAYAAYDGEWFWAYYFLAFALFLFVLRFLVLPWRRKRSFAHQRLGDYEIEFSADEFGFTTKSELAEGTQKWASIRHVDDLPEHVLLWPSNRMGWMLPKRAFASADDAAAFVALAKEKTVGQTL